MTQGVEWLGDAGDGNLGLPMDRPGAFDCKTDDFGSIWCRSGIGVKWLNIGTGFGVPGYNLMDAAWLRYRRMMGRRGRRPFDLGEVGALAPTTPRLSYESPFRALRDTGAFRFKAGPVPHTLPGYVNVWVSMRASKNDMSQTVEGLISKDKAQTLLGTMQDLNGRGDYEVKLSWKKGGEPPFGLLFHMSMSDLNTALLHAGLGPFGMVSGVPKGRVSGVEWLAATPEFNTAIGNANYSIGQARLKGDQAVIAAEAAYHSGSACDDAAMNEQINLSTSLISAAQGHIVTASNQLNRAGGLISSPEDEQNVSNVAGDLDSAANAVGTYENNARDFINQAQIEQQKCVDEPCLPGQMRNPETGKCEPTGTGTRCPPSKPTWSDTFGKCLANCSSSQQRDPKTGDCIANPCGSGEVQFEPGTDSPCKPQCDEATQVYDLATNKCVPKPVVTPTTGGATKASSSGIWLALLALAAVIGTTIAVTQAPGGSSA